MKKYYVLSASNTMHFNSMVECMMNDGWVLQCGVSVSSYVVGLTREIVYAQAFIKEVQE